VDFGCKINVKFANVRVDSWLTFTCNTFRGGVMDEKSFWDKLRKSGVKAGREVFEKALILYYVMDDPDVPTWAKVTAGSALAYLVMPFDAIPDAIPVVGFSDDLVAIVSALATIAACITKEHRAKAKAKTEEWFGKKTTKKVTAKPTATPKAKTTASKRTKKSGT
jgi:uncharacterized membrane protein YkvA (DUF1232 family)